MFQSLAPFQNFTLIFASYGRFQEEESFATVISHQDCIVCVLNFLTKLKIWNNNLHLSFTVPWRHKAIPPINSSKSIVPFCNRNKWWETFNTMVQPNGSPVTRCSYNLPTGDRNYKQEACMGA